MKAKKILALLASMSLLLVAVLTPAMSASADVDFSATEPAYEVLATATGLTADRALPDFQDVEVELKAGESVYIVVDPVNADGQPVGGGFKGVLPEENITVTLNGETKAQFGRGADSYGADNPQYTYRYSYTALSTWDAAADKTALLLDNLADMGAFTEGQWDNAGWYTGEVIAAAPEEFGMVGMIGRGDWAAMLSNASDDYVARAVLQYTATEAGTYVVDSGVFNLFESVTLYLLKDKVVEGTSSAPEDHSSPEDHSDPESSVPESSTSETESAYDVLATATGLTDGILPEFQDVTVTLKKGESLYIVLDPVNADGQTISGGFWNAGIRPMEDITVTLNGDVKARFGAAADSYGADNLQYTYCYSYTALSTWDAAADKTALLLDNLTDMGAFTEGQWDNVGWYTGTPFAAAPAEFGMVGLISTGDWACMVSDVTETNIARTVLMYTATEDGTYVVDSGWFNGYQGGTLYLLQDKAAEEPEVPETSNPETSNPEPPVPEESAPESSEPEVSTPEVSTPETNLPYKIVASTAYGDSAAAALSQSVSLEAGDSLYIVLDAYRADGTESATNMWDSFYHFEQPADAGLTVSLGDATKAEFFKGCFGGTPQGTAGNGFTFNYSYTAKVDIAVDADGKATDAADHLLDNFAQMTAYSDMVHNMGQGWLPGVEDLDLGPVAFLSQGGWSAFVAGATDTYVSRAVLAFEAAEDGKYTVTLVNDFNPNNVMYLLQDTLVEDPEDPDCDHENAIEVAGTAVAPTCTEKGKEADKVCPDCGEAITGVEVPALGHSFTKDEPLCSRCGERNPGYVYVPSGPYYSIALQTTADHHNPCDGSLFESDQYVTLEKGQKMYIVLDPVDAEGNLATGDNGVLECQSLSIQSAAGVEYATFGKYMDISGQGENGFTYGYSYTLLDNWTAETAQDLLLDNYAEMKWQASPSDYGTCQFSGTTDWWGVESTDELTFPQYLSIIGNHFGALVSQANDTMVARAVLVFEAPSDGKFKVVSQYEEWNASVESQVYVLTEPTDPDEPIVPDVPPVTDGATFTADKVTARAGDTITVAIRTKNNPGIVSFMVQIGYDAELLELVSIEEQDFAGVVFGPQTNNPIAANWCDATHPNNTTDGVVALLTFRVKEDAPVGTTAITLSYDPEDVYDYDMDNVPFGTENGTVEIIEYISGDVNDDGLINNKDLGLMQRYISGWDVEVNTFACDVNDDGLINNKDLGILQRYISGWDVKLP